MHKSNQLPEEVTALLDQFLRDMTGRGVGVFGLVYVMEPEPAMTIMQNRNADPVSQAESVLHIVRAAVQDGRIDHHHVTPLN